MISGSHGGRSFCTVLASDNDDEMMVTNVVAYATAVRASMVLAVRGEAVMLANRISGYIDPAPAPPASSIPAGFAVCQLAPATNPLALQIAAQQQAYEDALLAAREEALRFVLSRLQPSVN
jgi:hypothetical protein